MAPQSSGTNTDVASALGRIHRRSQLFRWGLAVLAAALVLAQPVVVMAQSPGSLRIPRMAMPTPLDDDGGVSIAGEPATASARRIIVDTDPGVDDALALVWLLSQRQYPVEVAGIVTVAGNSDIDSTTNNVLLLLQWLNRTSIPVVKGAAAPLVQTRSRTGQLIHGPDGLWFLGWSNPQDNSGVGSDATAFYCASLTPGTLVLALGPLTNLANAIETCSENWDGVEVVSLGGGKHFGNQTPTTEYNYWQDPEAAHLVANHAARFYFDFGTGTWLYSPGYRLTIVPVDAFSQFTLNMADMRRLQTIRNSALQRLLPAVQFYYGSLSDDGSGRPVPVPVPDLAATIYALHNQLGRGQPALVKILSGANIPELVRGQSIIGLGLFERISMIADDAELSAFADQALSDPNFDFGAELFAILLREPDNATVVTALRSAQMAAAFFTGLHTSTAGASTGDEERLGGLESTQLNFNYWLYLPATSR